MAASREMIEIDGGYMEGGGQILRMSLALSAITKTPVCVYNIRQGRPKPGLASQHLEGIKLVSKMCNGRLQGAELGSTQIKFFPGDTIPGGNYEVFCKTAGSVGLIAQAAYPCGLFAEKKCELYLEGGTNAAFAPPTDYLQMVFKKVANRFGANFDIVTNVRGFYPKGGGNVSLQVTPAVSGLKPVVLLDPGTVKSVSGVSLVTGSLPIKLAHIMAETAIKKLKHRLHPSATINIERVKEPQHKAFGNGSTIVLWAETTTGCVLGGSALGDRNKRPEQVGDAAAEDLLKSIESKACVDKYSEDQMIILMTLAQGKSRVKCGDLESHAMTAIFVAERMTKARFTLVQDPIERTYIVECESGDAELL